jgi:hypothetical protein
VIERQRVIEQHRVIAEDKPCDQLLALVRPCGHGLKVIVAGSTVFSLAHLTVLDLPPAEVVQVAARTGYQSVGLRLLAVTDTTPGYPLMDDPPTMRDTKSALADTAVRVLDIELVKVTPEIEVTGLVAADPQRSGRETAVEVWCAKEGRITPFE